MTRKKETKAKTTETLFCKLTDAEWQQRAEEMATTWGEIETAESEIAEFKAEHKMKRAELDARFSALAQQVRTREESRQVACEVVADWEAATIETYRTDTGERIRSREMTPQERQRNLDIVALGG